ncbi:hypothetical protein [Amycolatopsis sp. FDAARGOS 1241]|uniref:hypothetical protein n=1 Tax=Amycolatopsis sp. FDAARGOS 1241 TaxID=2778070 RepID=UPI00194E2534|nr:hypothetical protein [Amycolatopsis sp. FDAARGOS 1241]QRP44829.1 hypothetical protein I6J71_37285 [Amycolatopsis sp. FDAARGOS 1241]
MTYSEYYSDTDYYEPGEDERDPEFDALSETVDGVQETVVDLETRTGRELTELRETFDSFTDAHARHESRLDQATRQLERLRQRLQLLERAVRVSEKVPVVDLDDVGPALRKLAADAERRHALAAQLLTANQRRPYEEDLERLPQAREALLESDSALVAVLGVLATSQHGDDRRADAEARLSEVVARRRVVLDRQLPAATKDAEAARQLLDADDVTRTRVLPQIEKAERDWEELHSKLRERITDAIGSSALLPVWFTHAFGVAPPSGAAGDRWIRAATSALAYRVTHGVTDQALPLGEPPADDTDWAQPQWSWRARLEQDIEDLDINGD